MGLPTRSQHTAKLSGARSPLPRRGRGAVADAGPAARPFLKWAGGKRQLLPELLKRVPRDFNHYYEPFLGGGALLLALGPREATANDANDELIRCYREVRDHPEELIEALGTHRNSEAHFYLVRALNPAELSDTEAAARLVFLNRTCFNGLYRVNRSGQFNTPYGRYKNPNLVPAEIIRSASAVLQGLVLAAGDYRAALASATQGDFVYLDPPYIPLSQYSDFRRYSVTQFRDEHHEELANVYKELDARGCRVMLSNSSSERVFELYSDWRVERISARRNINSRSAGRGLVDEVVVTNYACADLP